MATIYWLGTADAVAQVSTIQITADDAATSYRVTIGDEVVSVSGSGSGVNATATALQVALDASTHPYFAAITWSVSTDTVTGTADTAGVPFVAASSVSGGTGTIGAVTDSTASAGPNDWSTAENWSGAAVPVNGDDVIIDRGSVHIAWGLDQSAVNLDSLTIKRTYAGRIGLDRQAFATSADGNTTTNSAKPEYRDHYLKVGADAVNIGEHFGPGNPAGSTRIKIHNDEAGASLTTVHGTASASSESGLPAIRLLFDNAGADLVVRGAAAGVGVAVDEPGETSNADLISVSGGSVYIGAGVTYATFEQTGGTAIAEAAATVTAMSVDAGTLITEGDYTITTLTVNGGTVNCNHVKSGGSAVTTLNVNDGVLNAGDSNAPRTWATVNLEGGQIRANSGAVTITTLNEPSDSYRLTVS